MLMSEKETRSGFSSAKLSHPSGFEASESILTNNVRLPSAESLLEQQMVNTFAYNFTTVVDIQKIRCTHVGSRLSAEDTLQV